MNRRCFYALLIFCLCGGFAAAARLPQDPQSLSINAPIERELPAGQTHVYRIALSAGQFAMVEVEQRGADVSLAASGPDGKEFASVDLRAGVEGVERMAIVADETGEYIIKVISRNPKPAAATPVGKYEAKIVELRAATEQDRVRAQAQLICYEALKLSLEQAPEARRKAVRLYEEALPLWRSLEDPWWESLLLLRLGRLHIDLTEFRQAKDYFNRALAARKALGDRRREATAHSGVCEALNYMGDMKGAAECYDALSPIYRELGLRMEEANAMMNKAATLDRLGDYQAALQLAQQASRIFQEEGDRERESFALNTLGLIYLSLNEHQFALDHYERALAIRREIGDKRRLAVTLENIGVTYYELGDFPRAVDHLRQSLALSEEIGDRRAKAIVLQDLGMIWKITGDTAKALDAQTQSLALAREVGDRQAEGQILISMSELHLLSGEKEKARDDLTQALELSRGAGDPVGEAAALTKTGEMTASSGDWLQAVNLLQQALSLARKTGDLICERNALIALAQTERQRNNFGAARDYHEKALELIESIRAKVLRQDLRASFLASQQEEYELYVELLMQMNQRRPDAGYAAAALGISERGRARSLLETLAEARADIRQGVDAGLLAQERNLTDWIRLKERQREQLTGNPQAAKQTEALNKEIDNLLNEYQSLQGRIRESSPRFAALTRPQPVTAAEVQTQCLDSQTILLEYELGEKHSWLWAVTPEAITSYELPPRAEIDAAARKIYELLTARQPKKDANEEERLKRIAEADAKLQTETARLSRMLLGPISTRLRQEWKGKRLVVVASGALQYVPFAALPPPEADGQMIANHEIVYIPSASTLAELRRETADRKPAAKTLAVLADPVFESDDPRVLASVKKKRSNDNLVANVRSASEAPAEVSPAPIAPLARAMKSFNRAGFSRLFFSREEAEEITELIREGAMFKATDFQANRTLAMSGELGHYRIIHFATHGLLNGEHPELSGLVLSLVDENGKMQDGFLRMDEIFNLRLPADLVVLSACQTALGKEIKGEGLVGLTRGFMYAGARRVVASLWQVDDQATSELMRLFYRGMLKEGLRPAAALREAQIEMSKSSRWSSPYYWAGFVLQGDWK